MYVTVIIRTEHFIDTSGTHKLRWIRPRAVDHENPGLFNTRGCRGKETTQLIGGEGIRDRLWCQIHEGVFAQMADVLHTDRYTGQRESPSVCFRTDK